MTPQIKHAIVGVFMAAAAQLAGAQAKTDFLQAPDRIEWDAGGLYAGRFSDGTPFQIELAYARPASLPADVTDPLGFSYWYPRHFTGKVLVLRADKAAADTLSLSLMPRPGVKEQETFSITLAPDKGAGQGTWNATTLGKQLSFSLERLVLYRAVALTRPSPEAQQDGSDRRFVFSTVFPLLADPQADAWVRKMASVCDADLECDNKVKLSWHSRTLVSLEASAWGYNLHAPHGNYLSAMRHYLTTNGQQAQAGLDAFLVPTAACRAKASAAIVAKLRAQEMEWPEQGALTDKYETKFMPLSQGIEFFWDPYEVGSYMRGGVGVFLTRAELGKCAQNLPASD